MHKERQWLIGLGILINRYNVDSVSGHLDVAGKIRRAITHNGMAQGAIVNKSRYFSMKEKSQLKLQNLKDKENELRTLMQHHEEKSKSAAHL